MYNSKKKAGHACSTRDCVQEADTREHRADFHSNLEKYVFFRSIFHNESGLGSAKIGSSKTISKPTGRNANMVCFNKFQRSSTVLHALALMRCLWYEMVYEKAWACWRACRIIVWGWKTCTHDPPFSFFAHVRRHFEACVCYSYDKLVLLKVVTACLCMIRRNGRRSRKLANVRSIRWT